MIVTAGDALALAFGASSGRLAIDWHGERAQSDGATNSRSREINRQPAGRNSAGKPHYAKRRRAPKQSPLDLPAVWVILVPKSL
jgi:hypothetical protein